MAQSSNERARMQEVNTPQMAQGPRRGQRRSSQYVLPLCSQWGPPVLVFFVAVSFNLYRLGSPSLWFDEVLSVERAQQSLSVLLQIIGNTQPNMALYYLVLHFWLQLAAWLGFNPVEVVVRLPSALFAALGAVMVFLLGRRFLGLAAGIVAAGMYALNVLQLVYAQETRSYALQLFLICIAWYTFLSALVHESHHKRWWVAFSAATALAVYAQLFSVLIWVAQLLTFLGLLLVPGPWRATTSKQLRGFLLSCLAIGALIAPLMYESRHGSKTGWLPIPHPADIYHLFLTMSASSKTYLLCLLLSCALGLMGMVLVNQPWGKRLLTQGPPHGDSQTKHVSRGRQWLLVSCALLCWLMVPVALSYLISQGPVRLFSSRYLVTVVPPLVLLVGLGVGVVPWRSLRAVLMLALFILALAYVPTYYRSAQVEDWNRATLWLEQQYQANDGLVCYDNAQGCQLCIQYYLTAYPSEAHFTPDSPDPFSWVDYDLTNRVERTGQAVDPAALAVFGAHHPRLFFIVGRLVNDQEASAALGSQHWLDRHYAFLGTIVTRTVSIRLYATSLK